MLASPWSSLLMVPFLLFMTLHLSFSSLPFSFSFSPDDTVASALLSLFSAQCTFLTDHGIFHINYWNDAIYGFEEESHANDNGVLLWQGWDGDTPAVVRNQFLCGRSSLYLRKGRTLVFNLPEDSNLA